MPGGPVLAASIGFNEAPVVRAIIYAKPTKVMLVAPKAEGEAAVRLERAVSYVRELAKMLNASFSLLEVERPADIGLTVFTVKRALERAVGEEDSHTVYVALRGGLRLLTLALLLTAQSMALSWEGDVRVIIEDELGGIEEFSASQLVPERLSSEERAVLRLLAEKTVKDEVLGVREAASMLGIPKSTAHKRLRSLTEKALAQKAEEGYVATLKGLITA